jgi:hypothetical protein
MESYPPQCSGPDILGWDWAAVDGEESASGVTWGAYAVQGTWDGERFTVTQPPMLLALYDPMPVDQPLRDPANAGTTSDERLQAIRDELNETAALRPLGSSAVNGYLFATYLYDDGDLQRYLDATYGSGVVVVESALRSVEG